MGLLFKCVFNGKPKQIHDMNHRELDTRRTNAGKDEMPQGVHCDVVKVTQHHRSPQKQGLAFRQHVLTICNRRHVSTMGGWSKHEVNSLE